MGKRTLGCCSHVAALVYFMGVGIYDIASLPKPGYRLKNILVPILNGSDEEDDNSTNNTETTIKRSISTASDIQNNPTRTKK
ncbi:unnamed protein product [Brachionus calyciflorus]|uniref:Uncharacterized protein n=1 Tax=Brachionus calyciflorus TaxID=104777 RepID=A0A813M3Z0_9BILA|nr:unnamed protein product [Brachionus calyciflorus]